MRLILSICLLALSASPLLIGANASSSQGQSKANENPATVGPATYLGFDANDYPGDSALPVLKQTFAFAGYWLNPPPGQEAGESTNTWTGKRAILAQQEFGFLVLFNGRWERELKNPEHAITLGISDAKAAAEAATREGFARGTIIFLDQEEGGAMLPDQMAYLLAWFDGIASAHFGAGVYCSGMPAKDGGQMAITAEDIRVHAEGRHISFFVYNDACPSATGCVYGKTAPPPADSGVKFAIAWQYAQSPRRHQFTKACSATYDHDGNCYAPGQSSAGTVQATLDLDSATSPDPSRARP